MSKASTSKKNKSKKQKSKIVKQPKVAEAGAKFRKKPHYKSFKLHRRVARPDLKILSWASITKKVFELLRANIKPIGLFFIIYGLLYLVFVRGVVAPVNLDEIRGQLEAVSGTSSSIVTNISIMSVLFESAVNTGGEVASLYQMIFLVVSALALIWLFRQQQAGNKVSIKDAFYRGMFPIIPFVLIIFVIVLQLLPAIIGNFLFTSVASAGIAVTAFEQIIWLLLFITTILLSLYMISSSVIALFIVTLPEMTPMLALNKAKQLVSFRRASVMRKVMALLLLMLAGYVFIVLPAIFISATLAQAVFFFLTVFMVPFALAYLFILYRELL